MNSGQVAGIHVNVERLKIHVQWLWLFIPYYSISI